MSKPTLNPRTAARDGCGGRCGGAWRQASDSFGPAGSPNSATTLRACQKARADVRWNQVVNGGHDVWTSTYDRSGGRGDVYAWLLANVKP